MTEWLFLLLPVAAASGWWAARHGRPRRLAQGAVPDAAFLRGLNYLLDERPDKAIDVFLRLAEVDGETVEIHLALGSLFRRRGEVDRAIRIHQNLVARPGLDREQRGFALYELAQDYMRAGLFDRAESLLLELAEIEPQGRRALKALIEIYQQEKDWANALGVAERLEGLTGRPMAVDIAQYRCELAEESLRAGAPEQAGAHLRAAQAVHPQCVRATMLQARIELGRGDAEAALALCRRVAEQGPQFIPDALPQLLEALGRVDSADVQAELHRLYRAQPSPALTSALTDAIERQQGPAAALDFLSSHLKEHADLAALEPLLEIQGAGQVGGGCALHETVLRVVRRLRACQAAYQCDQCGFVARRLHWQCPSCKSWGTIKATRPGPMDSALDSTPTPPAT
jgi:lipopolysaccharide biosynthesis regulator YciM